MQTELTALIFTAITVSLLHTLAGPDHYLPFIVLSKSRGWSVSKTIFWTVCCGCGHVWSSVLLALGGAALGWSISKLTWIGSVRGGLAAWCMVIFGLAWCIWGIYRAKKHGRHKHFDMYGDDMYVYEHSHQKNNIAGKKYKVTPWVMFIIFLLGPCEPMIPLLFFPAVNNSWWAISMIVIIYTVCTLITMVVMVLLGYYGISIFKLEKMERHMHSIAGLTVLICGAGMLFLGW